MPTIRADTNMSYMYVNISIGFNDCNANDRKTGEDCF